MNGPRVDLAWLGSPGAEAPPWALGEAFVLPRTVEALAGLRAADGADFLLVWDADLGHPVPADVLAALFLPGDLWHAGLALGQGGRPQLLEFVHPTWMLQRDPPAEIPASSWRVSLRAVLVRAAVWRQLGGPLAAFASLEGAALELGHRYLHAGVLLRHLPDLCPDARPHEDHLPLVDELLFLRLRCGSFWQRWAWWRALLSGARQPMALWQAWRSQPGVALPPPAVFEPAARPAPPPILEVSVLIPTLDRYPYLETLLGQLTRQTVPPHEVILVDQTAADRRRRDWAERFPGLPIRYLELDQAGQCSSRNAGLAIAGGDAVLFLDDDDEIAPDLIEKHQAALALAGADASCGVADEAGAPPLPAEFRIRRLSDVFPTNNSLVKLAALRRSGLFDLAFERGARADADLGQRLYLAGCLLVFDPEIRVLHHHAPAGGLRRHGARRVTYGASRRKILARHLPSATEIYLALRYFTARQVREALLLRLLGTFAGRGPWLRRVFKAAWAALTLPHSWWTIWRRRREARAMMRVFPQIPRLPGGRS